MVLPPNRMNRLLSTATRFVALPELAKQAAIGGGIITVDRSVYKEECTMERNGGTKSSTVFGAAFNIALNNIRNTFHRFSYGELMI